jgi:hypothetical protein
VIGLDLVSSWDDDGRGAIFAAGPGRIELFSDPDPPAVLLDRPHRPVAVAGELPVSIAWEVDDVDQSVATWEHNGATIRSAPTDTPWQTRMVVVSGPDGLLLCPFSLLGS